MSARENGDRDETVRRWESSGVRTLVYFFIYVYVRIEKTDSSQSNGNLKRTSNPLEGPHVGVEKTEFSISHGV